MIDYEQVMTRAEEIFIENRMCGSQFKEAQFLALIEAINERDSTTYEALEGLRGCSSSREGIKASGSVGVDFARCPRGLEDGHYYCVDVDFTFMLGAKEKVRLSNIRLTFV